MSSHSTGKDILWLPSGEVYHLGAKKGEIHNRLITVGDHARADTLSELLDKDKPVLTKLSPRLFKIHSGHYKGVPVSIVGIGMGTPMMDFFVRECSYLLDGPTAIIRLGSCGLANPDLAPGTIVVASKGSMYCYSNYAFYDGFYDNTEAKSIDSLADDSPFKKPFIVTQPVAPNEELTKHLMDSLANNGVPHVGGLNIAGETFYACQGRNDGTFADDNAHLLKLYKDLGVDSIEMETHLLMHLAKKCKHPLLTAGVAVGIVNRSNPKISSNVPADVFKKNVSLAGVSCLDALAAINLS